jgi:signal peptidase I
MEPTITSGSDLLADESHYENDRPRRWHVVVFSLPADVESLGEQAPRFMKRVIGLPGETIQLTPDGPFLDGAKMHVPPRLADRFSSFTPFDGYQFGLRPYTIPGDSVFLIGDNPRIYVSDSREFGAIPIRCIHSRVMATVRTDPVV